jgi:hypothetical protein
MELLQEIEKKIIRMLPSLRKKKGREGMRKEKNKS